MSVTSAFQVVFAVSAALAAVTLVAAFLARVERLALFVAGALAAAGAAAWVAFALDPGADLAVAAVGVTACAAAAAAAYPLARAVRRSRNLEEEAERAERRLTQAVVRHADERAIELERTLSRARADSVSLLTQQERQFAEERRRAAVEQRREVQGELTGALSAAQARVDQRLAAWAEDLERAQGALAQQATRLAQRQEQMVKEAEARMEGEAKRLDTEGRAQRETVVRLRSDLERQAREALAEASGELESQAVERRRALEELESRLRRHERQLREQIERQENEVAARVRAGFADVERRQVEQLERVVDRAAGRYAEAATQQFEEAAEAGPRGRRRAPLARARPAVAAFVREAQSVLSERLTHVGDSGANRLERRFEDIADGLERQREEMLRELESRLGDFEADVRRRLEALVADTEAERGVLEARLHDLARRVDELATRAEARLASLTSLRE